MTVRILRSLLVTLLLAAFLSSCGGETTPPHLGVFFVKGKNYVEIPLSLGGPDTSSPFIASPEAQPMITVWDPAVDLSLFNLVLMKPTTSRSGFDPVVAVPFEATPNDEGMVTLRPTGPLSPDVYCMIQGDYLTTPDRIRHWCFEVPGVDTGQRRAEKPADSQPVQAATAVVPVQVTKSHLVECVDPQGKPSGGEFAAAWEIQVNDATQWISRGIGSIEVSGTDGSPIRSIRSAFGLAANQVGWIRPENGTVTGNGSRIGDIDYAIISTQWMPARGPGQYDGKVDINLSVHSVLESENEVLKERPTHEITVDIHNGSDLRMAEANLFAVVLDSEGNAVSVLGSGSGRTSIDFGNDATLRARTAGSGFCSGLRDPNDTYEIRYWIDFVTPSDELLTYHGIAHTQSAQVIDDSGSWTVSR